uniref:Ribosomal protein L21 n=1 Tax=Nitzschia sp. (in: diatoms) TaxID=1884248 RepID=A0A5J6DUU2_9STRA|nr:ribosomal protein L21 [Nitzschia sp. (in: diatoms)]
MKYAIIEVNGKQFWIEENNFYDFTKINININQQIFFKKILLYRDNKTILLGQPYLSNTNIIIKGKVLKHLVKKKIIIYKFKSKKNYRRKKGYRHKITRILIENIFLKIK